MANKFFAAGLLIGGFDDAVDGIRVIDDGVTNGDLCLAIWQGGAPEEDVCIMYKYKDDWAEVPEPDDQNYIMPDYSTGTTPYTGDGRWYAMNFGGIVTP